MGAAGAALEESYCSEGFARVTRDPKSLVAAAGALRRRNETARVPRKPRFTRAMESRQTPFRRRL
jgi:hypothetical protein